MRNIYNGIILKTSLLAVAEEFTDALMSCLFLVQETPRRQKHRSNYTSIVLDCDCRAQLDVKVGSIVFQMLYAGPISFAIVTAPTADFFAFTSLRRASS